MFLWKKEVEPLNTALRSVAPCRSQLPEIGGSWATSKSRRFDDRRRATTTTRPRGTERRKSNEMAEEGKQREATMNREKERSRQRETRGNK